MKNHFLSNVAASSVFKKFVMGLTGIGLVGFVIMHLSGNLLLYQKEGTAFNAYSDKLMSFGWLLYAAEIGLAAFFLFHAITGIRLAFGKRQAKPVKYAVAKSKGGNSKWGFAANNMAITGTILLAFLIWHIKQFKYGPGVAEGFVARIPGHEGEVRDLHRLVVQEFKEPGEVAFYTLVMLTLAVHLRHGVWSALQSLGLTRENNSRALYFGLGILGILLGLGFLTIPIYVYFFV
jgi:succinate dehydrogenase / fumarate reductase cytochrome b subunit